MAKNFPFFKFVATEWLTGDIVYEPLENQGLFINICALYWQRDGVLTLDDLVKRYKNAELINSLSNRFFSIKEGFISIKFLDEQLIEANHISKVNSENGKKGAEAKRNKATANRPPSDSSANSSKEEKEEKEEKEVKFNFKKSLLDLGFDSKLVSDWMLVRKNKKATNTETALNSFMLKVKDSGMNGNDVLRVCVENSWSGFDKSWLKNLGITVPTVKKMQM